jgi:tetratricopeptide (TPR) repeat protein
VAIFLGHPEPAEHARRRVRRFWTIPVAPRLPIARFEGGAILDEVNGAEAGVLFECFRAAVLWTEVEPEARVGLFGSHARLLAAYRPAEGGLGVHLGAFRALVATPEKAIPPEVAQACIGVAEWAAELGHMETEYHFSALAAYASPQDPMLAFGAGRAARRQGRIEDGRGWFRRAVALARRSGDEAAYASAFLGWGILEERQGNRDGAAEKFARAWKAAKRGKIRDLAGAARHNLLAIALAERNFARGQAHIVAAYKLYGRRNQQLYRLANDAAGFWSAFGLYGVSLPLYEASLRFFQRADERVSVLANIAHAAAALGDRERYLESRDAALDLNRRIGQPRPDVLVELASGAFALGYGSTAKALASEALEAAMQAGPPEWVDRARRLLSEIGEGTRRVESRVAEPPLLRFAERFRRRVQELG